MVGPLLTARNVLSWFRMERARFLNISESYVPHILDDRFQLGRRGHVSLTQPSIDNVPKDVNRADIREIAIF